MEKEIFILILIITILLKKDKNILDVAEKNYSITLKKDLSTIRRYCSNNISLKKSRKFTSFTSYNKKKEKHKTINISSSFFHFTYYMVKKSKILIAIHSHISLYFHRYVFRKLYRLYENVQLLFFIGFYYNRIRNSILLYEMKKYKDIILFNFSCDYNTLYILTYNFLKWVYLYREYFDIIIKQDTDTFLNVVQLNNIINKIKHKNSSFVLGKIWNYKSKYKKYPSGMAYIFLSKSTERLTNNIDNEIMRLKYGYAEDMFFGILARRENFSFIDSYISYHLFLYLHVPDKILKINKVFMIHELRISEIAYFHQIVTQKKLYIL